jgi:hypothetical protein
MTQSVDQALTTSTQTQPIKKRTLKPLIMVLLLSLSPVVAAVLVYFNPEWRPEGNTNYGQLVEPQRPMPSAQELPLTSLDGQPFDIKSLKGQWLLVTADSGGCDDECAKKLFILRNTHAMNGKNVDRISRVWFVTDDKPIPQKVLDAYVGTVIVRADPATLARYLPVPLGQLETAEGLANNMWIIDPLGNLILQYPRETDPLELRKDIGKLLHSSRIG